MVMGPSTENCLDLLHQLHVMFQLKHAMTLRVWEEHELHPAAGGLLAEIARRGECRVSDLAQYRLVDASVVSRQVAQLERAGLVRRRPAEHDGRVQLISVTAQGEVLLKQWRNAQAEFIQQALSDWPDDAVRDLALRFDALAQDVRARLQAPDRTPLEGVG
jgi:DNA-binding MarR family transcriptional regulator